MHNLLEHWIDITSEWKNVFSQDRIFYRAIRLAFGSLCSFGRRTLSRSIAVTGRDQQDWSADYRVFSRSRWSLTHLFRPILKRSAQMVDEDVIAMAFDDTKLHKTGRHIETAFWQRDPLSPPFHANLIWGLRFLQASVLIPMYRCSDNSSPRAIPVQFEEVPAVKKPGKRATEKELLAYKEAKKKYNLSTSFVEQLKTAQAELDHQGFKDKTLLATVDGSFWNRVCFSAEIDRTEIIARCRKDASLCHKERFNSRRFYGKKFSPEIIIQDDSIPWKTQKIFHGGKFREVRFKEIKEVYWQSGTKRKELRLIVVAPVPYRLNKKKMYYRRPAYLLTTALEIDVALLIQKYFDRWQIEVNFRDEKDLLGVGQAQVRSTKSVPRQPGFVVASYAALLLAGILVYEDKRDDRLIPLPKWRKNATRPSIQDLITQIRREADGEGKLSMFYDIDFSMSNAGITAAA